jgi:tetratricopeptide (TPR) repeat protein/transcriptional regulator with XRE-family HTH domain
LRRRRKALDLTQEQLAQSVSCSRFAIRKIEADERRPSKRLAERLADKLDIPAAERAAFLEIARAVRPAHQLQMDRTPLAASDAPEARHPIAAAQEEATPFVGRNNEFGQLAGLVTRLTAGTGYVVLIEGEPGIGKSRLMREVARYAEERGLVTLATNCYEIERAMPYQPVIDLATQALQLASTATLRTLAPVSLAEIAALVPAVAERFGALPPLSSDFPEARQARLFRAIVQLVEALTASQQLVVLIDDVQWADDASVQFLHYFARQVARRPVLLACAYRDEELDSDERLAGLVDSLRREQHVRHMPLARLEPGDAEALVESLAHPQLSLPGLGARLHRETDGNPFFLTCMLHALTEGDAPVGQTGEVPLPDALRASVRARLAHVARDARPALDVAAVLGRRFDFETLLAITREPEERLLSALESLVKRRLLREDSDGGYYDFSHDKVREVVYRELGSARRVLLHRAVAETLEQRAEGEGSERDARLAEHYERAHVWTKALQYIVRTAERSQKLFAMRDALHWLDRALALAEAHPEAIEENARLALYERRGAARAQAGQTEGAVADIQRVIEAARKRGEREQARDALIQLGMAHRRADAYAEATACLTEALTASRLLHDERRAADTLYHLGTVAWSNGRNAQALRFHQEAVEICERLQLADLVAVQAFHGRGEAHFANSEPASAIACFTRSLELARGVADKSYECENLMMIGYACTGYMGLSDYPRAAAHYESALEIARAADLQWHMGPTLLGLDHVRACTGRYGEAWAGMVQTLRWLEGLKQIRYQLMAYDLLGYLLLDLGLNEQAVAYLDRGVALAREADIMFWRPRIEANLAIAQVRLGRRDVGAALQSALDESRQNSERYLMTRCLEGLAELSLACGDSGGCRTFADELLSLAETNGLTEIAAHARRWRGEALLTEKAHAAAAEELLRVARVAAEIGRPRLAWDAHAALARLGAAAGEQDNAAFHRTKARDLAAQIASSVRQSGLQLALPVEWNLSGIAPSVGP